MSTIHETRMEALRKVMREQSVDCVAICNSPNLFYTTGYAPKRTSASRSYLFRRRVSRSLRYPRCTMYTR